MLKNLIVSRALQKSVLALSLIIGVNSASFAIPNENFKSKWKSKAAVDKITGKVTDANGNSLPGVSVVIKNTSKGTITAIDGSFSLEVNNNATLVFSFIGYVSQEVYVGNKNIINITLIESASALSEIVVTGSRGGGRVKTDSPVPVDVIGIAQLVTQVPQNNLNQIMNMVAPSFTSNTTTVADGTDHIDPAQLRGLGPDQVLVLLNGKRRHTSSLVNVNGSPGRGSVGTDLNAIPAFAIEKIEVLRDGASAQYGSDAIAGIINVGMKESTGKLNLSVFAGGNTSKGSNNFNGGMDGQNLQIDANYGIRIAKKGFINFTASTQFRQPTSRALPTTGAIFNAYNAIEYQAKLGGANLNALGNDVAGIKNFATKVSYFTPAQQASIAAANSISDLQGLLGFDVTESELSTRGLKREDFNMRVGQSSLKSLQLFANSAIPLNENLEFYAFGGYGARDGNAAGFYRRPNQNRTYTPIYINGFLPEIHSSIYDGSVAAGLRGKMGKFNFDFSNTFGSNTFNYTIEHTLNATLLGNSPTTFNAGGLNFKQNTVNLDFNRKYNTIMQGLNLAFGAEFRAEAYRIKAGEEKSYGRYMADGTLITLSSQIAATDFFGSQRPGGSQVFPGFMPVNEAETKNANRKSVAAYIDTEIDVTNRWLVEGALRFENYSDFGSTFNYKFASRYKLTDKINIRGAVSTGFRAPSLAQIYFNSTSTQFVGGVPFEVGTFSNASQAAQLLGIPQLKQERSQSFSIGFTSKVLRNLTFTADAYLINIKDRVVLTDQFSRPSGTVTGDLLTLQTLFDRANANAATFFANAIDTRSKGLDIVVSHNAKLGKNRLKSDLAATFSKTEQVGDIHGSDVLIKAGQINRYYSETSKIYLERCVPRVKANLSNFLMVNKWEFFMRNAYFGKVTDPNTVDVNGDGKVGAIIVNGVAVENEHPVWGGRLITDFSIGYSINNNLKAVVGANNIFDIYPDKNYTPVSAKRPSGVFNGEIIYNSTPSTIDLSNANQFVYSRNVGQFGQNGRFIFARLNFTL